VTCGLEARVPAVRTVPSVLAVRGVLSVRGMFHGVENAVFPWNVLLARTLYL
ncbi:MAG: hypothetical protein JNL64_14250, partial [Blastocatellia bacterium]|nr:hypothetical protein [Blastocatellia bacterium]